MNFNRNLVIIFEEISIGNFTKFSCSFKLENYDWVSLGILTKNDLPFGISFPINLNEKWFEKPEIEIKIEINGKNYEGILEFEENLKLSGNAVIFEENNPINTKMIKCTILIEEIVEEEEKTLVSEETQTNGVKLVDNESQTEEAKTTIVEVATNTEGNFIEISDLEKILEKSVAKRIRQLRDSLKHRAKRSTSPGIEVEDPKPTTTTTIVDDPNPNTIQMNSYSLVPRMTQLKQLDEMIAERRTILIELDANIEMRRKIDEVLRKRLEIIDKKQKESKELKEEKQLPKSISKSSSSSSAREGESSSSEEEEEEEEEASESTTSESESASQSSSNDAAQSLSDLKIEPDAQKLESLESMEIEDPFSPKPTNSNVLSPTSEYLENLKKKILDQYNSKLNN